MTTAKEHPGGRHKPVVCLRTARNNVLQQLKKVQGTDSGSGILPYTLCSTVQKQSKVNVSIKKPSVWVGLGCRRLGATPTASHLQLKHDGSNRSWFCTDHKQIKKPSN